VAPEPKRRRLPPVALLALLALGLAGAATAIALVRPEKGTSSGTATEAIFETLPITGPLFATDEQTTARNSTTATSGHTTSDATTSAKPTSPAQPTTTASSTQPTTVAQKSTTKHKHPKPVAINDDFSNPTLDPLVWNTGGGGSGASFKPTNGQLVFSIAADATFDPQYHFAGSGIVTQCKFPGDFDARVAFNLLQWPAANGARIDLTISQQGGAAGVELIQRVTAPWGDGYNAYPSGSSVTRLPDQSGSLRLTRSNGIVRAFFRHDSQWIKLGQKTFSGEISIGVDISAIQQDWQQEDVSAAVDNFVLKAPSGDCPPGGNP
jgi:hypothetical protein